MLPSHPSSMLACSCDTSRSSWRWVVADQGATAAAAAEAACEALVR